MSSDKLIVATHEGGHAIVILTTALREYIVEALLYTEKGKWQGHVEIDKKRAEVDRNGVLEVAKGIGGPLAQLRYYPEPIPAGIRDRLQKPNDLLGAAERLLREEPKYPTNWWPDLCDWVAFCDRKCNFPDDYLAVQTGLNEFLEEAAVERVVRGFAEVLASKDRLGRDELLAINVEGVPQPKLPEQLRCRQWVLGTDTAKQGKRPS